MKQRVYEITLQIKIGEEIDPPSTFYWPDLIDCQDDDVEVVEERLIGIVEYPDE